MGFVSWKEDYAVNISELDEQHKKWFELLNLLYDAMKVGKSKEVMEKLFNDLIEYTDYHFAAEEKFLKEKNYPDLSSHLEVHKNLRNQIQDFYQQYKADTFGISIQVFNMLKDWLQNHILNIDKKYGAYFSK